jgi:hypothetical protein
MLGGVRQLLGYRMTIAEWIGAGLLAGAPYNAIGLVWALTHTEDFAHLDGFPKVLAFLVSIALWPVLLIPGVCA